MRLEVWILLLIVTSIKSSDNDYFTSPAAIHKLVKGKFWFSNVTGTDLIVKNPLLIFSAVEQHLLYAFTEYASLLEKRMEKVKE